MVELDSSHVRRLTTGTHSGHAGPGVLTLCRLDSRSTATATSSQAARPRSRRYSTSTTPGDVAVDGGRAYLAGIYARYVSRFSELIEESRARAEADPGWLGSESHRAVLAESLVALGISDVSLTWTRPGCGSYWQPSGRQLSLELPVQNSQIAAADLAELTALGLLHESLHIRHTLPATQYSARRFMVMPILKRATERLFNLIEDGRITTLATTADPELEPYLTRFIRTAIDDIVAKERSSSKTQRDELFFAAQVYALQPDQQLLLDPAVSEALAEVTPVMDKARIGSTADADMAAVEIIEATMQSALT
jgi:hypothetical protein